MIKFTKLLKIALCATALICVQTVCMAHFLLIQDSNNATIQTRKHYPGEYQLKLKEPQSGAFYVNYDKANNKSAEGELSADQFSELLNNEPQTVFIHGVVNKKEMWIKADLLNPGYNKSTKTFNYTVTNSDKKFPIDKTTNISDAFIIFTKVDPGRCTHC